MPIVKKLAQPWDLVCSYCGSDDVRIADSHGWVRCEDCGEKDHAIQRQDFDNPIYAGTQLISEDTLNGWGIL